MKLPQQNTKLKTNNMLKNDKKDPSRLFIINVYICLPILLVQLIRVFLNSGSTLLFELVIDFPLMLLTVLTSLVANGGAASMPASINFKQIAIKQPPFRISRPPWQ